MLKTNLNKKSLICCFLAFIIISGCSYRHDYDVKGKIIDFDTRQPLEGVIVIANWSIFYPNPAGGNNEYYDSFETSSDKNGDFTVKGRGPVFKFFGNLASPSIRIFKAGYEYKDFSGNHFGASSKTNRKDTGEIKWEGEKAIVALKKLTLEEIKDRRPPSHPPLNAPIEKIILYFKEINKERQMLGLKQTTIWRGKSINKPTQKN